MAVKQRRTRRKPPNGQSEGGSYLLVFDLDDESQRKAWQIAQQLASQRKLKSVLVGFLLAVHTIQEKTGRVIDLMEFMAQLITGLVTGGFTGISAISEDTDPEELPSMFMGTDDHADPIEARENFAFGMGDLFADDGDVWDD
jgi:hypothetical protein